MTEARMNARDQERVSQVDQLSEDPVKKMSQMHSQKMRLDLMDKNFEDLISGVKNEIAFAAKRDSQLVDRRH